MKTMIRVFGITGTNGKTTAACMLKEILQEEDGRCALIGTIEYQIGDRHHVPINTTPVSYTHLLARIMRALPPMI